MRTQYLYTSEFCPGSKVVATYENGVLSAIDGIAKIGILWESIPINAPIPFKEEEVEAMAKLYDYAVTCSKLATDRVGEKIRAFCAAYKQHFSITYKVTNNDPLKLEALEVNEVMLEAYFTNKEWWGRQPKSIANYAGNYNNLRQLLAKSFNQIKKYPTEPDMNYLNKLTPSEGMKAMQQWHNDGWRAIKSATGDIIKWNPPAVASILVLVVLLVNSCGLLSRVKPSISSEPMTVVQSDTVSVAADTLQGLVDPEKLLQSGVWDWENDRTVVQMVMVDSSQFDSLESAGWTWLDHGDASLDGAPTGMNNRPQKAILVRVISKPLEIIEEDTTCVDVPAPTPVYPAILDENQVNIWWLISAALALVSGIVFFIRKKKKDGQGDVETE